MKKIIVLTIVLSYALTGLVFGLTTGSVSEDPNDPNTPGCEMTINQSVLQLISQEIEDPNDPNLPPGDE